MRLLYTIAPLLVAAKSRLASRLDDNALLRRAKAIDDWFAAPTNRTTPVAWTVRRKSDVQLGEKISSKAKTVYRGSMRGAPVIVKGKGRHAARGDYGGDVLWEEMIYLEALRGEPGIVPLHGAWFSDDARHVSFVVGDCGPPIGKTSRDKPPLTSRAFDERARKRPLELAKAILECFGAWASRAVHESNRRDASRRDAGSMAWRCGRLPLVHASTAASSPRNDLVKNYRVHPTHWLICAQVARIHIGRLQGAAVRDGF